MTESPFSVDALHQGRPALLQSLQGTEMEPKDVLSLDDTLLTHYGKHFAKIAYLYDSTHACYVETGPYKIGTRSPARKVASRHVP